MAGLVGGAGLLWAAQPNSPAQNAAAGAAAGTQASNATGAVAAPSRKQTEAAHYKPVYDIPIANKNYPREVPAFIEVCVQCVYMPWGVLGHAVAFPVDLTFNPPPFRMII